MCLNEGGGAGDGGFGRPLNFPAILELSLD